MGTITISKQVSNNSILLLDRTDTTLTQYTTHVPSYVVCLNLISNFFRTSNIFKHFMDQQKIQSIPGLWSSSDLNRCIAESRRSTRRFSTTTEDEGCSAALFLVLEPDSDGKIWSLEKAFKKSFDFPKLQIHSCSIKDFSNDQIFPSESSPCSWRRPWRGSPATPTPLCRCPTCRGAPRPFTVRLSLIEVGMNNGEQIVLLIQNCTHEIEYVPFMEHGLSFADAFIA